MVTIALHDDDAREGLTSIRVGLAGLRHAGQGIDPALAPGYAQLTARLERVESAFMCALALCDCGQTTGRTA